MNKKVKITSQSSLYTGNVKITLLKGKKPYKVIRQHNEGLYDFFRYICEGIMGKDVNGSTPTFIIPLTGGINDNLESRKLINYGIVTEGTPDINGFSTDSDNSYDSWASLTYTFLIPGTVIGGRSVTGFLLQGLDNKNFAILNLASGELEVNDTSNILIQWTLRFANGTPVI